MTESKEVKYLGGKCLCIDVGGSAIKHGIIGPDLNLTHKGEVDRKSTRLNSSHKH